MKKAVLLAAAVLACSAALAAAATVKKTAFVTIPVSVEVKAAPAVVWKTLNSPVGLAVLSGFATSSMSSFTKVGDFADGEVAGDKGRYVVTELVPEKELRLAFEPAKGHYLCQVRAQLSPSGAGTKLDIWERYTDDQPNADETAAKQAADLETRVTALRKMVEK